MFESFYNQSGPLGKFNRENLLAPRVKASDMLLEE